MRRVTLAALGSLCVAGCGSRAPSSEAPPILAEADAVRFGRTWVGGARAAAVRRRGASASAKSRCPAPAAGGIYPSGPPLEPCTELDFGRVPLGEPCSGQVEIVNARDIRGPTAALAVTSLTLRVRDETQREVLDGAAAGFSVEDLEASGAPPSTSAPWLVPIPEGETEGRRRRRVTVTPRRATRLTGAPEQGAGLRFGTGVPASPELVASLHVTSELPQVRLAPRVRCSSCRRSAGSRPSRCS